MKYFCCNKDGDGSYAESDLPANMGKRIQES